MATLVMLMPFDMFFQKSADDSPCTCSKMKRGKVTEGKFYAVGKKKYAFE
jgi:hypothetical protein